MPSVWLMVAVIALASGWDVGWPSYVAVGVIALLVVVALARDRRQRRQRPRGAHRSDHPDGS